MSKPKKLDPKTEELLQLMSSHGLTTRAVGKLVGRSRQAVKRWTGEFTVVDQSMLDLLKYKLKEQASTARS
jgi:hypothetical protein